MGRTVRRWLVHLIRALVTGVALYVVISSIHLHDRVFLKGPDGRPGRVIQAKAVVVHRDRRPAIVSILDTNWDPIRVPLEDVAVDRAVPGHPRPMIIQGFGTMLRRMQLRYFFLALLIYPLVLFIGAVRWHRLMAVHDIHPTRLEALRLTWVGFFWSLIFPGVTGGDLVKAYYISRQTAKRTASVITVFFDRIVGIVAMALLSGAVILLLLLGVVDLGRTELDAASKVVGVFIAMVLVGTVVFFSRRIRRALMIDRLLEFLPFQRMVSEVDRAVFHYRHHKLEVVIAFGLSVACHLATVLTFYCIGRGLRMSVGLHYYFIFIPVILIISAIPITLAGLGLMEAMFVKFFTIAGVGATAGQALALCILFRIVMVVSSTPGAILSLKGVAPPTGRMVAELENDKRAETESVPADLPETRTEPADGPV